MLDGKKINISMGTSFEPIAEGAYICQIVDVDLVSGFNSFKGKDEDKLNYQFAILNDDKQEDGSSSRNRFLWKRCSLSMNEKAWLFKLFKAVLGRQATKEEMEEFDAESLIGKTVKCLIDQNPSKDGTKVYNNIISFSKADKKLEAVEFTAKPKVINKETVGIAPEEPKIDPDQLIDELNKEAGGTRK